MPDYASVSYTHLDVYKRQAFSFLLYTDKTHTGLIKYFGIPLVLYGCLLYTSLGGAVFGMGEEALPFTMILCPLFVAVGYDSVIAVLVTYVATQIGFGSSWMNPFSVGIAQGIAGIDVFSGAGFRMVMSVSYTHLVTPIFGAPNRPKIRIGSRMMLVMAPHS